MTDLRTVLELATDEIDSPDLGRSALATAELRRTRRRGALTAVVAVALVAGVVLVPRVAGPSPDPMKEPASTPTPTPTPVDTNPATQAVWDPESIVDFPLRPTRIPTQLNPQDAQGPSLEEQPMSGVVAALSDGSSSLRLLDVDGTWRTVAVEAVRGASFGVDDVARPAISSDGTRVALGTDAGIRVIDVTGDELTVPWPDRITPPWDRPPYVEWQPGDAGFIVYDFVRPMLVGLDGSSREAPYRSYALGVDPDGPVYQNDFDNRTLLTWEADEVADESPFVQCERMVARHGLVACTTGSLQFRRSGPVVVDAATGELVAYAPIKDRHATYSDGGGLTLLGFLDEDTLLMLVGPGPYAAHDVPGQRHLVAWQFQTGEFQRISTGDATDIRALAVAPDLVE